MEKGRRLSIESAAFGKSGAVIIEKCGTSRPDPLAMLRMTGKCVYRKKLANGKICFDSPHPPQAVPPSPKGEGEV